MPPLKAVVRKGRLLVNEPTDLPEGTEIYLSRATLAARPAPSPIDVIGDRVGCWDSGRTDLSTRASKLVKERIRARHQGSR